MSSDGERGNVGEPPVSWPHSRMGGPGDHRPWGGVDASPTPRAPRRHHARTEAGQGSGSERRAKRPEMGRVAVVAEHSTGEGGEPRPPGPTGGKATPGLTLS